MVRVADVDIGKLENFVIMAGPCAVESKDQLFKTSEAVEKAGAHFLRGGAYKPRTRGGDWEGLKEKGLEILVQAKEKFGLPIVTEILSETDIELFKQYGIDMFQVGARNVQNQTLLNALGKAGVPVLLKNGMNTTDKEWMGSATRIPSENLVLCLRGKNNDTDIARNELGLVALAHYINKGNYPVIVDPSHSTGRRDLVYRVSMASVAAGAHGLLIETHHDPENAITDGAQSILPKELAILIEHAKYEKSVQLERLRKYEATMKKVQIPVYFTIYFEAKDLHKLEGVLGNLEIKPYKDETTGVVEAKLNSSFLGHLQRAGFAAGKIFKMGSAEAISLQRECESKILISPFSADAVKAAGKKTLDEIGQYHKRLEFRRRFPGDSVLDGFATYDRITFTSGNTPLVLYRK